MFVAALLSPELSAAPLVSYAGHANHREKGCQFRTHQVHKNHRWCSGQAGGPSPPNAYSWPTWLSSSSAPPTSSAARLRLFAPMRQSGV